MTSKEMVNNYILKYIEEDNPKHLKKLKRFDNDLIIECIKDVELPFYEKRSLILEIDNEELKKKCVKDESLGLDSKSKTDIIISIEDDNYKKECIKDESLGLNLEAKTDIISFIGDDKYKKECLQDESLGLDLKSKVRIITSIDDNKYKKERLKDPSLGLDLDSKVEIIMSIDDDKYKKECLKDASLGLDLDSKVQIIVSMGMEFKKACLKDESLGLDSKAKATIVLATDEKFVKKYVRENEAELEPEDMAVLIGFIGDKKLARKYIHDVGIQQKAEVIFGAGEKRSTDNTTHTYKGIDFNLPPNMTIGIEIESEGNLSNIIEALFDFEKWKAKGDGSLENGVEVISPILHPTEKDANELYKVTQALNALGQTVSDRCGGHIHIGADYLTSAQAYFNLNDIWCNTEKILYTICNEKDTAPRKGVTNYAVPFSTKMQKALQQGSIDLTDNSTKKSVIGELKKVQGNRYSGLNLLNVNNGKNTIEFRLANGTINPDLWMDNINLFGGIIAISEELAKIQLKDSPSDKEKLKLEIFEKLLSDIEEFEKFKLLMDLLELDISRYQARYETNTKLMPEAFVREEEFFEKRPIRISKEDIRKATKDVSALAELEALNSIVIAERGRDTQTRGTDRS